MAGIKKGTRIGPYQIKDEMPGVKGGMSSVYRASDMDDQTEVALKISRMDFDDPRFNNALKQEVDILKDLRHPGIVRLIGLRLAGTKKEVFMARALELSGKPWYYTMEFLAGRSLRDFLKRNNNLPFPLTCAIATRLVDSLIYMHSHGVAHLDVKPENILFRYPSEKDHPIEPVLIDFGVAARTKSPRTAGGSLHTMAPEQLRHTRGELPPETSLDMTKMDIYSMGVVAYRMWTGDYPFGGVTAQSITNAVLNMTVRPPTTINPNLPKECDSLIARWLAKEPNARPTLDELKRYLYFWSDGTGAFSETVKTRQGKRWWMFWRK